MLRSKKALIIAGYVGFALFSLLVSLYLTFPADAVGQRLAHEVQKLTSGKVTMSFDSVSLYRLSGVEARGVRARIQKDGQQPLELAVDAVKARLRILPLLWFSISLDTELELGDGAIDVRLTKKGEGFSATADFDDVKLQSPPIIPMFAGIPLGGTITGSLETEWQADMKETSGKMNLVLDGVSVGPGTVSGFTIPSVGLGKVALELLVDQGKLRVASFKQEGGDVHAKLSGASTLRSEVAASTIDMCFAFKAEDAFLEKNPKLKTAMSLAEVTLKKGREGYMDVPLSGTFAKPRFRGGLCRVGGRE